MRLLALIAAVAVLAVGLYAGFATGADGDGSPTSTTTTTAPTTEPTSTSTTAPTTTAPTTTNNVTTAPTVETTITAGPIYNTTTQASAPPETVTVTGPTTTITAPTTTTTSSTPPTAPCDTTAITCGNNAATQVALVSQTCNASSSGTILSVQVQTIAGDPVNNVTIAPTTSCLNIAQITQIVSQYCVGCTVIVIPPPPPVTYVPVPGTNTVTTQTVVQQILGPSTRIEAYCNPKPAVGQKALVYLAAGTPQRDPAHARFFPASFVPGVGMKCPGAVSTIASRVPMFTLTVPASFVGQSLRLCLQGKKVLCHTVKINLGATVSIPVSSSVVASVVKTKPKPPPKLVKKATGALALLGK